MYRNDKVDATNDDMPRSNRDASGRKRNGSTAAEPATTLPPIEGNVFELHIPLAMIEAALARHRQRSTQRKLAKAKPKKALMRFSIPLVRIEMPLNPIPRKSRRGARARLRSTHKLDLGLLQKPPRHHSALTTRSLRHPLGGAGAVTTVR
jgi:hypothetical protein